MGTAFFIVGLAVVIGLVICFIGKDDDDDDDWGPPANLDDWYA